jgi:23S rRNA-/tRNA-specific pseudouridylate synthase
MHQIRRHLAGIGHPVMADKRYGGGDMPDQPGIALHSFRTILDMENTGALTICAPLPEALLTLCERRGIGRDQLQKTVYDQI